MKKYTFYLILIGLFTLYFKNEIEEDYINIMMKLNLIYFLIGLNFLNFEYKKYYFYIFIIFLILSFIFGSNLIDINKTIQWSILNSIIITNSFEKRVEMNGFIWMILIGSWLGCFSIPLDWDVKWQYYPILSTYLLIIFSILGSIIF